MTLSNGFPHGRALCETCLAFVRLTDDGTLWNHDSFRGARSEAERADRADWFNTYGWGGADLGLSGL